VEPDGYSDRQLWDRRQKRRFVVRERRSGFDRRARVRPGPLRWYDALLESLRERPGRVLALLALGNAFSVVDVFMTFALLRLGYVEGNPLLAHLMQESPVQAALVKAALIASASVAIWLLRRHRSALQAAVFLVAVYGLVVTYELAALLLAR
jgi:hypothetical protein